eukprot:Rhum_TRINITY_DN14548_c18_g1::Rhum_TRINITY_DN14548_c18_g1_i1::g.97435::m.97435/K14709/SLC39A1_2_3, ZIP1_2_3; solute carrier family 39 (zinc transporter), member 1/2/3
MLHNGTGLIIMVVWAVAFAGCLLPMWLKGESGWVSYTTVFSAGVILAVALCHLLPDAAETLAAVMDFPLANFLAGCGFFLVLAVEKVFLGQHEAVVVRMRGGGSPDRSRSSGSNNGAGHSHSHFASETPCYDEHTPCLLGTSTKCKDGEVLGSTYGTTDDLAETQKDCDVKDHHHHVAYSSRVFRHGLESGLTLSKHMAAEDPRRCEHDDVCQASCHPNPTEHIEATFEERPYSMFVAFTVLFVLSFHSVIEGLALGSAQESREVFVLTVAILSHKFLAALSLGISFYRAEVSWATHVMYAGIFSVMSPFGAVLGVVISDLISSAHLATFAALCQAVGSGSFLYISLMEFIPEELTGQGVGKKLAVCFVGFLAMGAIAFVV